MDKPKILVIFYSLHGHVYELVKSAVDGVKEAEGIPIIRKVPELIPEKAFDEHSKSFKETIMDIPFADPLKDLKGIDGIIFGTPTRYGNMTPQMKYFIDQTIDDWLKGTLIGKPASILTSSATQHGGQETTIISSMLPLIHHGCVFVGLPY